MTDDITCPSTISSKPRSIKARSKLSSGIETNSSNVGTSAPQVAPLIVP